MNANDNTLKNAFDNFALYLNSFVELDRIINLQFNVSRNSKGEIKFSPSLNPEQGITKKFGDFGFDLIQMSESILLGMANENRTAYIFTAVIFMMTKAKLNDKLKHLLSISVKPQSLDFASVIFEIEGNERIELQITADIVEKYIQSKF